MSKAFTSIAAGLNKAIEFSQCKKSVAKVHEFSNLDIKAIREKTGLTQAEFATTFGISLGTLRHWERGDREPRGPALVLLHVLARNPQAVLSALPS